MTDTESRFIEVTHVDGVAVARFHDLNAAASACDPTDEDDRLTRELFDVTEQSSVAVVLDFECQDLNRVGNFESVLLTLQRGLGDRLRLCNLPTTIANHFNKNQVAMMFQVHTGLEDALAAADTTPFLALPTGQRILLNGDRLLVGRIPRMRRNIGMSWTSSRKTHGAKVSGSTCPILTSPGDTHC